MDRGLCKLFSFIIGGVTIALRRHNNRRRRLAAEYLQSLQEKRTRIAGRDYYRRVNRFYTGAFRTELQRKLLFRAARDTATVCVPQLCNENKFAARMQPV